MRQQSPVRAQDEPAFLSGPTMLPLTLSLIGVAGALAVSLWASRPVQPVSQVRVHNASAYALHDVVVNAQPYGDIAAGQDGDYRDLAPAYRYARIHLRAGTHDMSVEPDDFFGETPLGQGRFTYVLTITDVDSPAGLAISVERAAP